MSFLHGIKVTQQAAGPRPIQSADSSVIGVVITAPMGPVNKAVLINGSRSEAAQFGTGIGTAANVFDAIFDQVGAKIVVVNVLDPAVHKTAVAPANYTFSATTHDLTVANKYNYARVVTNIGATVTYVEGVDYTFEQGTGKYKRTAGSTIAAGETVVIGYDIPNPAAVTDANVIGEVVAGTGQHTGLQALRVASSAVGAKPRIIGAPGLDSALVAAELVSIAEALRGFTYLSAYGAEDATQAKTYRANIGSKNAMIIWPDWLGLDINTSSSGTLHATARALGVRAKIDLEQGWHKTLSNVTVNGVTGISKDVSWDLQNPNTVANDLNGNEVTTLVNTGAGFVYWGNRTCSADPMYAFESAARTDAILADTIAEAHLWAMDKPMSKVLISEILEGINAKFRQLKTEGRIVDATAWLDPDKNSQTELAAGKMHFDYNFTPVPPLENPNFYQTITNDYLVQLVS